MSDKAVNAGVIALTGFELQRNCILFLLLKNYDFYKDKDFFVCIEHHDDFLFAFTTNNHQTLLQVNTYQSKKKSGAEWKINAGFGEIITKILGVGTVLKEDSMPKSQDYSHLLTFISNTCMAFEFKPNKSQQSKGKIPVSIYINEQGEKKLFKDFPKDIQAKINDYVRKHCEDNSTRVDEVEFDNLRFHWIDFPKTAERQKEALIGLMFTKFPHVADSKASIDLFIELFKVVEQRYNNGGIAKLLDESKRLYSNDLKKALEIIQVEQKTYEEWRKNASIFAPAFKIPIFIQDRAEDKIREIFEYFKDLNNLEHLKIKEFVANNDYRQNFYNKVDMFISYMDNVKKIMEVSLNNTDIFFTCLCAYVEHYEKVTL